MFSIKNLEHVPKSQIILQKHRMLKHSLPYKKYLPLERVTIEECLQKEYIVGRYLHFKEICISSR